MCWMVPARPSGAAPLLVLSCSGAFCSAAAIPCVKSFGTVTALMLQLSRASGQESAGVQRPNITQTVGREWEGRGREGKERKGEPHPKGWLLCGCHNSHQGGHRAFAIHRHSRSDLLIRPIMS